MAKKEPGFTESAVDILRKRYLDEEETIEERFRAVAETVNLERADEYYELMINRDFLPNTPTIVNAGRGSGQLSACFVLPVNDSMHDILMAAYNVGMIQKTGGGTGFTLSRLRPKGALVSSTRGTSSGPISFLHMYNAVTNTIKQGGVRRGANMATMRVDHPDILEFIACKNVEGELSNFNISVMLTDLFMEAVKDDTEVSLIYKGKFYKNMPARELFNKIAKQAWLNGEPGVIFIDTINKAHPEGLGNIDATNPCGEQPLLDYESCNLGSINLVNVLKYNPTANKYEIDFSKLRDTAIKATAFLDDVISVNKFVLPEIEEATLRTRKIGLGVMGWGDVLVKLKIPYGSEESLLQAATVMRVISEAANEESKNRAKLFGPYPAWTLLQGPEIRNATRTTIAPTGSLAAIAGVSWGIEPLFGLTFRKTMLDEEFVYVNEEFKKAIHALELASEQEVALFEEVKNTGSCQHIEEIPKNVRDIFKTAQDLSYKEHIMMQEAFQRFTDNAVSKTINLHNNATVEDVKDAIKLAHQLGCKGLTLYRAGTRREEAVSVGTDTRELPSHMKPKERPKRVYGFTEKQQTGCGKLYVTVNSAELGKPIEVFIEPGSDGGCEAYGKALSRTISLGLRAGVPPEEYVRQLKKVSCKNFIRKAANGKLVGKSCPDVVGRILQTALKTIAAETKSKSKGETSPCPNCGRPLISAEGCWVCTECGFSECNG